MSSFKADETLLGLIRQMRDDRASGRPPSRPLRLVAADRFEELGHPARAEYVRRACGFFQVDESGALVHSEGSGGRRRKMKAAEAAFSEEWTGLPAARLIWSLGFVETVFVTFEAWAVHGPRLVAENPVARVNLALMPPIPAAWHRFAKSGSNWTATEAVPPEVADDTAATVTLPQDLESVRWYRNSWSYGRRLSTAALTWAERRADGRPPAAPREKS